MFICPHCGERSDIFGHGGAREEAVKLNLPFLGEVPLNIAIRTGADEGAPVAISNGAESEAYRQIATTLWQSLTKSAAA